MTRDGIAVLGEELGFELGHHLGPRTPAGRGLLGQVLVEAVVVVEVVGGQGPEQAEQARRASRTPARARDRSGRAARASGRRRRPPGRAGPGQVVEPDVLELHGVGIDPEVVADAPLDVDGDVAQPHRPVALVGQRLGHDPHRVGEVDEPGSGARPGRRSPRRSRGPAARCATPWPTRPAPWSPGRGSRTRREASRPYGGRPARPPGAGRPRSRRRRWPGAGHRW